jgi:hypothetical protein
LASEFDQPLASVLGQRVRVAAKTVPTDLVQEVDGRRHCQIGRWIARAAPQELVAPHLQWFWRQASPAEQWRADGRVMLRRDVQEAAAERSAQPLVAAGAIKIAAQAVQFQRQLGDRVRTVDAHQDPTPLRLGGDLLDGQSHRRRRRNMADDHQPRTIAGGGEDRVDDLVGRFDRQRQFGHAYRRALH